MNNDLLSEYPEFFENCVPRQFFSFPTVLSLLPYCSFTPSLLFFHSFPTALSLLPYYSFTPSLLLFHSFSSSFSLLLYFSFTPSLLLFQSFSSSLSLCLLLFFQLFPFFFPTFQLLPNFLLFNLSRPLPTFCILFLLFQTFSNCFWYFFNNHALKNTFAKPPHHNNVLKTFTTTPSHLQLHPTPQDTMFLSTPHNTSTNWHLTIFPSLPINPPSPVNFSLPPS